MRQTLSSEWLGHWPGTRSATANGSILLGVRLSGARLIYRNEVYDPFAPSARLGISAENSGLRRYPALGDALASDLARYELVWAKGDKITFLRRP